MIRKIEEQEINFVKSLLKKFYFQNPYFYSDVVSFGFEGENIATFVAIEKDQITAAIYKYYESLQLCVFSDAVNVAEIAEFISNGKFDMVSGNSRIIEELSKICDDYEAHFGSIMCFSEKETGLCGAAEFAKPEECCEIAQLICSDKNIGGHYSIEILEKQLKERMRYWNCKSAIIKSGDKIVAHAATYADCDEFSIVGGVITHTQHRSNGYGAKVVSFLTQQILSEGKNPILYCYEPKTVKWYEKNGWEVRCECGKLERKKSAL